ncbi:MAG: UDP-2,3-diacylglucosamine diphosphatase LpxI [Pseudomonadota bacterium]
MLALIAGQGALPAALAKALEASNQPFVVAALKDSLPDCLDRDVDIVVDVADLGAFFARLKSRGVTKVTMAGAVTRPDLGPTQDAASKQAQGAWRGGDDTLLRVIIGLFEDQGLSVVAAHDVLPDLLPDPATHGPLAPSPEDIADADRAQAVQAAIGSLDIGQACAVFAGQVLAIETDFGTAAMLHSLAEIRQGARGGVFYKAPKPDQDRRADLPIIGSDTVEQVAKAGLNGLVIQAGGVMVLDQPGVVAALDRHGVFLWIRPQEVAP